MLPAESIAFETLERLLPEIENLDHQLLTLSQKGWIAMETGASKSGGDFKSPPDSDASYFKCSPVVQEVVKWKNPDLLNDCQSLVKVLIKELDDEQSI